MTKFERRWKIRSLKSHDENKKTETQPKKRVGTELGILKRGYTNHTSCDIGEFINAHQITSSVYSTVVIN